MRVLVLSDLHLGNGGPYDIFAGEAELPSLLTSVASEPTHVVLNGDTFDFLLNDDPLALTVADAVRQAKDLVAFEPTREVLSALGRVLAGGGRVTIVPGNHDLELNLPEVQEVVRAGLGQPEELGSHLTVTTGLEPLQLKVGTASVLITHGEQDDDFNRIDYDRLVGTTAQLAVFEHPPGSLLVKQVLNPLKREHGLRYMDLLKPDFGGAVLTALGTAPGAARVLLTAQTLKILSEYHQNRKLPPAFVAPGPTGDRLLGKRFAAAGLDDEEAAALLSLDESTAFGFTDVLVSARRKVARAGLEQYARLHRRKTTAAGEAYFELPPEAGELEEARRLGQKFGSRAVIMGHTHAARWHVEPSLAYANTGTWISLLRLPSSAASNQDWADFLSELQTNPSLDPAHQQHARVESRFTAAMVDATGPEVTLSLVEWVGGALKRLGATRLTQ